MMGVLPLQFKANESCQVHGLTGRERFDILGLSDNLTPQQEVTVRATADDGTVKTFQALARIDTPVEVEYYQNGGILQTVLRKFLKQ